MCIFCVLCPCCEQPWQCGQDVEITFLFPGWYLCLRQHQWRGHFKTFGPWKVLVDLELVLQLKKLLTGKGCSRPTAFAHQVGWWGSWKEKVKSGCVGSIQVALAKCNLFLTLLHCCKTVHPVSLLRFLQCRYLQETSVHSEAFTHFYLFCG